MKLRNLLVLAASALALAACETVNLEAYADASNKLDPDCYKNVNIKVTPVILGFWIVPVVSGDYQKTCNKDQAPGAAPPLAVGHLIAPDGPP